MVVAYTYLFSGRCTVDDTGKSTNTRNTSFLQDDASSTSDEECMLLLSEQDGLFANALNNMANQEESTGALDVIHKLWDYMRYLLAHRAFALVVMASL